MGNTLYSPSASLYSTQDYKIGTRELWGKPESMTGRGGAGQGGTGQGGTGRGGAARGGAGRYGAGRYGAVRGEACAAEQ